MTWLVIVILAVLVVALYPVVRDFLRQRRRSQPAYVEGLQAMLDARPDAALKSLKEAVETDTDNVDAYIRLGDIYMAKGDTERALRLHENLGLRRNLEPRDQKKVYAALARDYIKTDRRVKAIAMYEELARVDKHDWACREKLIELYVDTASWDKCDELLKEFRRRPELRARAARLLVRLGRARAGEPAAARAAFEDALRSDPESVEARLALGDHQLAEGDTEAAIKTWTEVINAAPERNGLVRERLERAYFDVGRFEDVTQLYERLLRRVPSDTGLAVALAGIYRKKGDLAGAIRLLEPLTKGDEPVPGLVLAQCYLEQGDTQRARALLEGALGRLRTGQRN